MNDFFSFYAIYLDVYTHTYIIYYRRTYIEIKKATNKKVQHLKFERPTVVVPVSNTEKSS